MLNYVLILFAFFVVGQNFAQEKSIQALKQAQDQRKNLFASTEKKLDTSALGPFHYVDPFIGTGGHGHTFPAATVPFGMMQLGPNTRYEGWDGCSGYHYSDSVIFGFSHTHLSGTGVSDYNDLLLIPQVKQAKIIPGYKSKNGYGARFSHQEEQAEPGFYQVNLTEDSIQVRLTTTERAGMHEYTFHAKKGKKYILIDLDHRDKLLHFELNIHDKNTVSGTRVSNAWATEQHFYFHLNTNIPFQKAQKILKNGQHKLLLIFPENTNKILVKVGMSAVDEAGAKLNLEKEINHWNFELIKLQAKKKWEQELGKITIETSNESTKINFYTALYHTLIQPNIFSDVDGKYRGRDKIIHTLEKNQTQYTVFSLWDTYRAANPLYTIIQPKRTNDFIQTFLRQFREGGDLPVWELAGNETDCMIGYHSVSVIADAYAKGIRNYNAEEALQTMVFTSKINELGKLQYAKNGFISSGDEPESVSKTLEYAYDDFCIGTMAKSMGNSAIANNYLRRSLNFMQVFDPSLQFMRARRGGAWYTPFDPAEVNFNYTEANSWQYSLYAPHAVTILSDLMGGKDSLETWLDRLFTTKSALSGREQVDITGLIGQYAHGNEPSHHMAYLYNYTNAPHKTAFYVDKIAQEMYAPTPDGLSGNEDCGQMSAWYILSALGIYQIAPGNPWYEFGRPIIDKAEIQLEKGNSLVIRAMNNSSENKFIQTVTLNGKILDQNGITHEQLVAGGELIFEMGPLPSTRKMIANVSPLTTESLRQLTYTPSPFFRVENRVFDRKTRVHIEHHAPLNGEKTTIQYRYSYDTTTIYTYNGPFVVTQSCEIQARQLVQFPAEIGQHEPILHSQWVATDFILRDTTTTLQLSSAYDNQYAAAGPNTLIDGIRGSMEFRTGDWQGYFGKDVVAEVRFNAPKNIEKIGVSCLQDMKSWIFYPAAIEMEISNDGVHFSSLKTIETSQSKRMLASSPQNIPVFTDYVGPTTAEFYHTIANPKPIVAIRFKVKNFGKCPDWHLGAGNNTWLFIDEIILE